MRLRLGAILLALCGAVLAPCAASAATPVIAIVLDDMGDRPVEGARIVALPGAVACAILPGTPHGSHLARAAHAMGKEVLLHFPLQPQAGKAHPLAVTTHSSRADLVARLRGGLEALPFVDGVNIHQGSLLSQRTDYMNWMMAELRERGGLYFVDSFTSGRSVALPVAEQWRLPSTKRQIFIDAERGAEAVRMEFRKLIATARRDGSALAIGHPFPETLALLESELPRLADYGVKLVAPSELIDLQQGLRPAPVPARPLQLRLMSSLAPATTATAPLPLGSH